MSQTLPNDPILNTVYNIALDWAASWILSSMSRDASDETVNFGKNMAMSIRAGKRDVNFQENFFDAIRADPYMLPAQKEFWLSQESGLTPHAPDKSGDSLSQAETVKSSNPTVESAPL